MTARGCRRLRLTAALAGALAIGACSTLSDWTGGGDSSPSGVTTAPPAGGEPVDDTQPVAQLYNKGLESLNDGDYRDASKEFEEVVRQHPYSSWAPRATLMAAYAYYQRNAYDDAINTAQNFITLHPGHEDAAYAYYLIALSHYEQIADVRRDQTATEKALSSLEEVSRRFPDTPYAQDAEAKAVLARDHLAGKEMEVGRYYLNRHDYVAAINRFQKVVTDYQTTSHIQEALYRLVEAYLALGIQSEAQTAAAVLGHNYPNSQWYDEAFALLQSGGLEPRENEESWISQALASVNPF